MYVCLVYTDPTDWEVGSDGTITSFWTVNTSLTSDEEFSDSGQVYVIGGLHASTEYHHRGALRAAGRYLTDAGFTPYRALLAS